MGERREMGGGKLLHMSTVELKLSELSSVTLYIIAEKRTHETDPYPYSSLIGLDFHDNINTLL